MNGTPMKPQLAGASGALPVHQDPPAGKTIAALARLLRQLSALCSRRPPPLQLELADRVVNLRGMREFEFALASRSEFPAESVCRLMTLSPAELERAAASVLDTERQCSAALSRSVGRPRRIGELMREMQPGLFAGEHRWREIMAALVRLGPRYDPYKRVALAKYIQYLRSQHDILRSVLQEKSAREGGGIHGMRKRQDAASPALGDTAQIDAGGGTAPSGSFARLPKGETVRIDLHEDRECELILAGYRFRVYTGRECYMVDDGGNTFPLVPGKNLVGRHSGCDVMADSACRAISRNHLIIEPESARRLRLTDLSSHGTQVPARYLIRR